MSGLHSPITGTVLLADTPHSLSDGVNRWPVVDDIPFLRLGRDELIRDTLTCLDLGDRDGALMLLLADQDDWWDGPVPDKRARQELVRKRDTLTLRDAMALLAYGRVGDYFAHRWSDPTFLAGLALIETHWPAPARAFELACGIGHYLRELERCGVSVTGADIVFSKLWLARHWIVSPAARLLCFDAAGSWPTGNDAYDLVLCQDAFYFLEPKDRILAALERAAGEGGVLLVGHIHNVDRANESAGRGLTVAALRNLFPNALCYDDAELTRALAYGRTPRLATPDTLRNAEAFAVAAGASKASHPGHAGIAVPAPDRTLRRNPLYGECAERGVVVWPSDRYAREYGDLATYPRTTTAPLRVVAAAASKEAVRRREFVDLPERW